MKEKDLQNKIKKYYERQGCIVYKTMGGMAKMVGGFYSQSSGWPDLMIFQQNGEMFFIEVKNENGKLRDTQILKIRELQQAGYMCYVARPDEKKITFSGFEIKHLEITQTEANEAQKRVSFYKDKKKAEKEARKKEEKLNERIN